jgi:hypothetical protein
MDCPECGADGAYEARFQELVAKELADPGYGVVHHLTVATHMLQHSSTLTLEGWLLERGLLVESVIHSKPPSLVRKEVRREVDSANRKFSIASKSGRPVISKTRWAKTIMSVRAENADVYCRDVIEWAKSVLQEAPKIEV